MDYIQGNNRNQIRMISLEQMVEPESMVRIIDAFVDMLNLEQFDFNYFTLNKEGCPPYHPATLMKLIDGKTIAVDSFKIRAQNSLKNNFNEKKVKRHIDYIDKKIAEYEQVLDQKFDETIKDKLDYNHQKKRITKTFKVI